MDAQPIFVPHDDPFVVRFHVTPTIWLPIENSIPIYAQSVWISSLSHVDSAHFTWVVGQG